MGECGLLQVNIYIYIYERVIAVIMVIRVVIVVIIRAIYSRRPANSFTLNEHLLQKICPHLRQ